MQHMQETCVKLTESENPTGVDGDYMLQVYVQRKTEI